MARTNVAVKLVGEDGNAFYVISKVQRALKEAGYDELAQAFVETAFEQESYDAVLRLVMDYVEVE